MDLIYSIRSHYITYILHRIHHRESFFLLLFSVEAVVVPILSHSPLTVTYRHNVYALSRLQVYLPVVLRHSRDDILARQRPPTAHARVFYPYIMVLFLQLYSHIGILDEDGRVWFAITMQHLSLVVHLVLYRHRRGQQFM